MKDKNIRCIRCNGRKKMYKFNNGYTHINMGAPEVNCPMCLGEGYHKSLEEAAKDICHEENIEKASEETINSVREIIKKDLKDDKKKSPSKK